MLNKLTKIFFKEEDLDDPIETKNNQPTDDRPFEPINIVEEQSLFEDVPSSVFSVNPQEEVKPKKYVLSGVISPIFGQISAPIHVMSEAPLTAPVIPQTKNGHLDTVVSPIFGQIQGEYQPFSIPEPVIEEKIFPDLKPFEQIPANQSAEKTEAAIQALLAQMPPVNKKPDFPNVVTPNEYDDYLENRKAALFNQKTRLTQTMSKSEEAPVINQQTQVQQVPQGPVAQPPADLPLETNLFGESLGSETIVTENPIINTLVEPSNITDEPLENKQLRRHQSNIENKEESLFDDFEANFATTELNQLNSENPPEEDTKFNKFNMYGGK